jgi:3-hydroxyacyl-[acyl-carrier-protein] dehydratase
MSLEKIHSLIPHRPPMLLVDEIVEQNDSSILCRKTFRADEYFYQGHYPDNPITPGVILCEAAVQAGAILVALKKDSDQGMPVLARITDSRFKQIVKPGQTVDLHATLDDFTAGFCFFSGKVVCDGKLAVRLKYVSAMLHAES